jgi:ankyrin repeat protein
MYLPPELICMVKSYLTNRDLYNLDQTSRKFFFATLPNVEETLRKCMVWNRTEFLNDFSYICGMDIVRACTHICCWKRRIKYLSLIDLQVSDIDNICWTLANAPVWGNLEILRLFCETYPDSARHFHNEALSWFAKEGDVTTVRFLCGTASSAEHTRAEGARPSGPLGTQWNVYTPRGGTPAVTKEDILSTESTALLNTVRNGHVDVLKFFCDNFQFTIEDIRLGNNLMLRDAAANGHLSVLIYIVENFNLTLEDVSVYGFLPLREASRFGHFPIVHYMCENFDIRRLYVLEILMPVPCSEITLYLCRKYQLTKHEVLFLSKLLHSAASIGNLAIVKYLCETFQLSVDDVRTLNERHYTPMRIAADNGHFEVLRYFCEKYPLTLSDVSNHNFEILSYLFGKFVQK